MGNYCTVKTGECPIFEGLRPRVILEEKYAVKKDGSTLPILKSVIPIKLKGQRVLLEAFIDLSARKEAETAMKDAKIAAENANKAKSEFLATMSHEIRPPMNAIMGVTDLLLSEESREDRKEKLRILVVEDNAFNLKIVKALLKRMNLEHDSAENGKIAMEKLKTDVYDLVLLDMHMPVMDGMETIAAIRSIPAYETLRVIALTANAIVGDREKYIRAGCNDYLSKPLKREILQEKIRALFPEAF